MASGVDERCPRRMTEARDASGQNSEYPDGDSRVDAIERSQSPS